MKKQRLTLHLVPFLGQSPLDKITSFDIERYKKHRLEEKAAKGTINRELAVLSHLFNKVIEWTWVDRRPSSIKRFKEEQGRIVYLTTELSFITLKNPPITNNLSLYLSEHLKSVSPDQVWLFPAKKSATGHTMNIEKAFRRVVSAAGLDPKQVVRHTLRHTAITHLVQAGVDLPTVKRISGHKTLQMVERYSHQNGAHIQAAMEKLEQRYRMVPKS